MQKRGHTAEKKTTHSTRLRFLLSVVVLSLFLLSKDMLDQLAQRRVLLQRDKSCVQYPLRDRYPPIKRPLSIRHRILVHTIRIFLQAAVGK